MQKVASVMSLHSSGGHEFNDIVAVSNLTLRFSYFTLKVTTTARMQLKEVNFFNTAVNTFPIAQ